MSKPLTPRELGERTRLLSYDLLDAVAASAGTRGLEGQPMATVSITALATCMCSLAQGCMPREGAVEVLLAAWQMVEQARGES